MTSASRGSPLLHPLHENGFKGGRLSALGPETIEQITAALDDGASKAAVCRRFKVACSTRLDTLARVGWTGSEARAQKTKSRDPSKRPKLGCAQCASSGEDVSYHHCHASVADLTRRVADFEARLNREPFVIADRLWVKDQLDPEEEKLRFSR